MNQHHTEEALDAGGPSKTLPPRPEAPQPQPAPAAAATPARASLHAAVGNSRLAAAAAGDPPPPLSSARLLQPGQGNAAVSRTLIQRKAEAGGPDSSNAGAPLVGVGAEAREGESPATAQTRPLIVADDAESVQAGQMRKSEFLSRLRAATCDAAAEVLAGTQWSAEGCPFIERAFTHYSTLDAARLERGLRRYAPEANSVTNAEAYIPLVTARVRRSLATWVTTGQITGVPEGVPLGGGGLFGTIGGAVAGVVSGIAGAVSSAVSGVGGLLLKGRGGAAAADADPAAVQAQLGEGQALDGGARQRMESAFGAGFGDVRVHADAGAARLSEGLSARAFTVGQHIAFGQGEYQPGTPVGEALIAHELAHVLQQRGAGGAAGGPAQKGASDYGALEEDADGAAVGAVVSAWGGDGKGLARVATSALPSLKSGLRLQRCEVDSARPAPTIVGPEDMESRGFHLHLPQGEPSVGRTYEMSYTAPPTLPAGGYTNGRWHAIRPGQTGYGRREGFGVSHSWTLDAPGEWTLTVEIPLANNVYGYLSHTVNVRGVDETTQAGLGRVRPRSLTDFFTRLEVQNLENINYGMADQSFGETYITLAGGENPARPRTPPDLRSNRYGVRPPPGVTPSRYQWSAVPNNLSGYPTQEYFGHRRREVAGRDGFDLGTGATAQWTIYETGVATIYCTMYDAQGAQVAEARYRQVVLTDEESERVRAFQDYMREAREQVRAIRPDTAVYVAAVHLTTESGAVNELSFFLGTPTNGRGLKLIDLTPGVAVREYDGADFAAIVRDFNEDNSYPEGQLRLRVPENSLGVPVQEWTFHTTGASFAQRLSSGWGWASLGLAALGVLSAVIPGAQGAAPVFFMASAALGAASAGASLYQRSQEAHPSGTSIAIDIASLAGSLIGMAGAANVLRHGPRIAALTRTGRFVLYTGFASEAVGGVFILAEGAEQIAAILEGRGSAEEKASAVARVLAGLMLNGALLAWGARDLGAARRQVSGAIGEAMVGRLTNAELHALSILEGPAMARLANSSIEEVQSVAALIRENPQRAMGLVNQYGEQFVVAARGRPENLEELAQSLHAGTPELAGTRGSYGPPAAPGVPRPVYIERPGQSSPNALAGRIRDTFLNPRSPFAAQLAEGATLRVPAGAAPTHYELVIPAAGARAEIVIPVRIESTPTRPTQSVHGAETGPARMEIRSSVDSSGATRYEARIEVHRDLSSGDVPLALGHELDELGRIAISGVRGADITAQKRASLMRAQTAGAGSTPPAPTAHDFATAREFELASRRTAIDPTNFDLPADLMSRALSMGFGNAEFLDAKIRLLREAGVREEVLHRLRVLAVHSQAAAAFGTASPFATRALIGHIVGRDAGGSGISPISGLHLESELRAFQARAVRDNLGLHLVRTADSPRVAGGVTYNAYEQWRWVGGGSPTGSRPANPVGVAGTRHGGWELAPEPKTTFSDTNAFLQHANAQWGAFIAARGMAPDNNLHWVQPVSGGLAVAGRVAIDAAGNITHRTVYPHRTGGLASW